MKCVWKHLLLSRQNQTSDEQGQEWNVLQGFGSGSGRGEGMLGVGTGFKTEEEVRCGPERFKRLM